MRRALPALVLLAVLPSCGGGGSGSSSSPTAPTSAAPPAAAEFAISVSVGSRPVRVQSVATPQATGKASITIDIVERRSVQGEVRKLIATLKKGTTTVATDTLEQAALRLLAPGGTLTIPGGGRLSIPYTPSFPFTRDDQITIDVEGEFVDVAGNTTKPTSPPVPVPVDNIATCVANPNHLCLNNQRFQVDVLVNGARVTTMQRLNDTDGRFEFDSNLSLLVKVLDGCGLNSRYRVELLVSALTQPFTVFVTDTLVSRTRTYVTGSSTFLLMDDSAFATCP
ncbi:MAG: hypothetical protein AB7P34_00280 [Vicinamibacterales bacterium]